MIPLRDSVPRRTYPFVNNLLLALNVAVFLLEVAQGPELEAFLARWAFIPDRLLHPAAWGMPFPASLVTVVTAMFLHGGFLHLAGNLLYLWIFGDNVEDALGHFRYLVFYLASGVAAAVLQTALNPDSAVPNVGASGAIAGVLGGYFVLYPRARVVTLVPLFFLFPLVEVPAAIYLLFWFVMQFWMGWGDLAAASRHPGQGGVAWWAHVGGFVAGVLLVLARRPRRRPAPRFRIL
ncbi:MAG TPA: rhomboid family intramembrane serine protease [Thermoanaerobaculia bacterium]|nr:rhomboid family intramembrane serine protease [Thermoanaerobaculia bacterium]